MSGMGSHRISEMMKKMRDIGIEKIEPDPASHLKWLSQQMHSLMYFVSIN